MPPSIPQKPNSLATASLVCGILSLPTCWATAVPAIITGHLAWAKGDRPKKAKWGLILGYGSFAMVPLIAMIAGLMTPIVMRHQQTADRPLCMMNAKQIGYAIAAYQQQHGRNPADLRDLENGGHTTNIDGLLRLRKRHSGDWLYFPNATIGSQSGPLLVSPNIGNQIVVLNTDLSATMQPSSFPLPVDDSMLRIPAPIKP